MSFTLHNSEGVDASTRKFQLEFRLALASARWPLSEGDVSEIRDLATQPLDWDWFKRIVERNQIIPLVYHNLRNSLSDLQQVEILKSLRDSALGQTRYGMSQAAELVRVSENVKRAGLEMVVLKGLALSVVAFGNLTMRSHGDIDLLVRPEQVLQFEQVLLGLGYKRFEPGATLTPRRLNYYLRYYKHFTYLSEKGMPLSSIGGYSSTLRL